VEEISCFHFQIGDISFNISACLVYCKKTDGRMQIKEVRIYDNSWPKITCFGQELNSKMIIDNECHDLGDKDNNASFVCRN